VLSYGSFEIVAVEDGRLKLPAKLRRALPLLAGDLLAMQLGEWSLHFEIYRELLEDDWSALGPEVRSPYVVAFLSRPLASIDARGRLAVPPEVFQVTRGDRFILQAFHQGGSHALFLFRSNVDPQGARAMLPAGEAGLPTGA
jgi:DNA-binding transcriptional regulator/RsmH inhibitor MraZ